MSNGIERPVFFENQILGAADLTAAVEHSRGQQARHNRFLHLWGIAQGLGLTEEKKKENGEEFITITLSAGMAIDGTGREIVIPQSELLSENKFSQLQLTAGTTPRATWFPVFLIGQDRTAPQPSIATGACNGSLPTRVIEDYEVTFGRPGSARELDQQDAGRVVDGPGRGGWKVLLGFVQVNESSDKFTGLKYEVDGIGRRYAGVQSDEVAARGGVLNLRTRTASQPGKPALVLNEDGDGLLQFGPLNQQGKIIPVFTIDAQGNVTAEGKIAGAVTPGSVQVQSGIAMDGLLLPLPPGIEPEDIEAGKIMLHSHVTPHIPVSPHPNRAEDKPMAVPLECFVDSDRRVRCKVRWFGISESEIETEDFAAPCDYTVIVSVPAITGGKS